MKPFLTAVWSDLILASYAVPEEAVRPYLRAGLTPDIWQGSAWCSLVAFDFRHARVLGLPMPPGLGVRDFPEFNLRLYAREGDRRGVVFVRELVPSPLLAGAARLTYNEPYSVARMTNRVSQVGDRRRVRHDFIIDGRPQMIAVSARGPAQTPAEDTFDHWVKEQEWGFGRQRDGTAIRYFVQHPTWRTYPIEDAQIRVETDRLYGPQWRFLRDRTPDSVVLAEGSAISVDPFQT
jgi:uncharacterized protein YqjF (DUF2071 family)